MSDPRPASDPYEAVRELDPAFLEIFTAMAEVPRRSGHLTPRMRAFVALAVDANITHFEPDGVRRHVREALEVGATPEQVMEVLECSATVSVHALNVGVPVLTQVLADKGVRLAPVELSPHQQLLKQQFARERGYWNPTWDAVLELAPDMFEAYTAFSSHPWRTRHLTPLERELVYVAFDTSATHLYETGLKLHVENALAHGASPEQLLEVMEIAALIGMKSVALGASVLREELEASARAGR